MRKLQEVMQMNREESDIHPSEKDLEQKKQRKLDRIYARPILWYLIFTSICVFGRDSILAPLDISETIYYYIRYGLPTIVALYAMLFVKGKYLAWFAGLELLFGFSYLFAYTQDNMLVDNILVYTITTLIICTPGTVCLASIEDYDFFYQKLKWTSVFVSTMAIIYIYQPFEGTTYSMPASYQILWCSVLHVNEVLKKNNKKSERLLFAAFCIFEVITIFLRGARGPLVCFAIFLAAKIIIEMRNNKVVMIPGLIGVAAVVAIAQNVDKVLAWISSQLNQMDLYSRNLDYIMSNAVFDGSGRDFLRNKAVDLILERPLWGYGASSDVKLLDGQYVHSLPLELMFDFGVLFGGIAFVLICIYVIGVFFSKEGVKRDLKLIFLTEGFVMLFFSGTYLQSVFFFLFIGIVLSEQHNGDVVVKIQPGDGVNP